ncbi:MAG: hypothetical protein P0Y65_20800 [Candidatus Devosia phytovorans]|uniref:Uncharacterized protein n=1 Tax=Candidatus Devosia phytovorans TaxID=3121372 RepID=A0AAJ6AZX0_9HYPH|nr:hypothetical protein [Devosia sp.]WEK04582.1 MAG: hypothetical protein P0Y65_20800 [Devosia sp.]
MRRTIISAVIGAGLAFGTITGLDAYANLQAAAAFGELQKDAPSDWLQLDDLQARGAVFPEQPTIRFVATPSRDLLIRMAISPRNADTGNVLCSGGGRTVLYERGVPITFDETVSQLTGLDSCDWPLGRYRVRMTFLMTEPKTQIAKSLLIETEDLEVVAPP